MEIAYLITENTDLNKDFSEYDRFYIGDQYCEYNLFYFLEDKIFLDKILSFGKKITLTTPIISNKNLNKLFSFVEMFEDLDGFEVVVNEYGVFQKLVSDFKNIKIIWGNFLSGQNKDPYLKVFKDKEIHKTITVDNDYYNKFFEKGCINNIELYNTFQGFEIKKLSNKTQINIYYPYVVYSINRYCITNLIYSKKDYLTVVENCSGCKGKVINDLDMDLKVGDKKIKNYFRGNKQFYENIQKINKNICKRVIFNYDLL